MSEYMCDICSKPILRHEMTPHTADKIRQAVHCGLDPWKTPGIDSSMSLTLLRLSGLDNDEVRHALYERWRQRVMRDTTDWGLCDACTLVVKHLSASKKGVPEPERNRDYSALLQEKIKSTQSLRGAVRRFEDKVSADRESAEKRFWLGAAYMMASAEEGPTFLDRAIDNFQQALQIDPEHENTYAKLLGAYLSKGDKEGVRATACRWASFNPNLPEEARRWLPMPQTTRKVMSKASFLERWLEKWGLKRG